MGGQERRAHARYVIDGLNVEIAGVLHETTDISRCAVAVIRQPGVKYDGELPPLVFKCEDAPSLNQETLQARFLLDRRLIVVIQYEMADKEWEAKLAAHDVRVTTQPLEPIHAFA